MFVLLPLCDVPSSEKSDRFLEFIANIAPFTSECEPACLAYAWFRNAKDTDAVPSHWVRGIEVYETPDANRVTHRAGEAYQAFRAAVAAEDLLNGYPDMRFWCPTNIGFLTRAPISMADGPAGTKKQYIVMQDLSPNDGFKGKLLDNLRVVAQSAQDTADVGSFWVLEREDKKDGDEVIVFSRFDCKESYEAFVKTDAGGSWGSVSGLCQSAQTTTWSESGIGFLGR